MTCSPTSNAMVANAAPATTRRSTRLRAPKTRHDKYHGADDRGREEVGELAPAIDDRATIEHPKCVLLQAVGAVTA